MSYHTLKTKINFRKYTTAYAVLALLGLLINWVPLTQTAQATIPKYVNFQGKLTNKVAGTNVTDGTYAFEFKIYDAVTSGSLLWTETFDQASGACGKLTVTSGVFNAKLGSCNALTIDMTGGSLFLSVNFAPTGTSYDGEMSPRKQLVSSPFAFVANSLNGDGNIDLADFDVDSDGKTVIAPDTTGDALTVTTSAAADLQALVVSSSSSTQTAGIIQVTSNTITDTAVLGMALAGTVQDAAGALTVYGNKTLLTVDTDAGSNHTAYGQHITIDNDDAGSTVYGLYVDADGDGGGEGTEYAASFLDGNVGIGLAAPTSILHIQQSTDSTNTSTPVAFDINSVGAAGELTASSGTQTFARIAPVVNQTGSASYDALLINPTETSAPGTNYLFRGQVGGTDKFKLASGGEILMLGGVITNISGNGAYWYRPGVDIAIGNNGDSGASSVSLQAGGGGSSGSKITFKVDNADQGIWNTSGLGIGSASPEALLEVQGIEATDAVIALDADDGDDTTDTWFIKGQAAASNSLSLVNHTTEVLNLSTTGALQIDGDLTISGDDLIMATNTDAFILVADGTNYNPVAMSGDITITNAGATAIGNDKVVEADLKAVDAAGDEECLTYETTTGDFEWQTCGGGVTADSLDFIDFEDTLDLDAALVLNQGTNTWTQNFTGTTTTGLSYVASSLTTGTAIALTGPTSTGLTGGNTGFVEIASDIGSAGTGGTLLHLSPDFSNAGGSTQSFGVRIDGTDATGVGNTNSNIQSILTLSGNAAKTAYGLNSQVSSSSTTADTLYSAFLQGNTTGIITSGTRNVYGAYANAIAGAESTGGTTNVYSLYAKSDADVAAGGTVNGYGLYIANGSYDTDGTSTQYGLYVAEPTGADTNYAAIFAGGNVGIGDTSPAALFTVGNGDLLQVAPTTDTFMSLNGNTTNDSAKIIDITQANNSNEDSSVISIANTASVGTITSGTRTISNANWSFAPVVDLSQISASATTVNVYGLTQAIDVNNITLGDSALAGATTLNTFANNAALSGTVAMADSAGGGSPILNYAGYNANVNISLFTAFSDGGFETSNTYGGRFVNTSYVSHIGTIGASNMYGIRAEASGSDADITNKYGGRFTATGAAGTNYGIYVDSVTGASNNYAAIFAGGNVGIGDTTPSAALEVGDGTDSLQVSSVGDLTFVDANGAASITGSAGGALSLVAGASQALTLTGNNTSTWSTSSGGLTVQGASTLALTAASGAVTITATGAGNDINLVSADIISLLPAGFITHVGGGTTQTAMRFLEPSGTGTDYAAIQSNANVTTSYTWTLPAADASGCIQSNGSGTLSIAACGGGSLTPWTSDIDADGYDLNDLSNILFRETTGAPTGTDVGLFRDNTGDLNTNVLTGKTYNVQVNGTDEYNFSSTAIAMNSNNITGLGTALTAAAGLTVTATSADLALVTSSSGNITMAPASTGNVRITSGVTTGSGTSSGLSIAAASLTSGAGLTISGGSAMTSGNIAKIGSGTFVHTGTETGNALNIAFTDASTNASGSALSVGIDMAPTLNAGSGAGPKTVYGINVQPVFTACGTTGGSCDYVGIRATTDGYTQTTTNLLNLYGNKIYGGALVQNTAGGTINWYGSRTDMPSITQTTGSITSRGMQIVNGDITTAGTQYMVDLLAVGVGAGTLTGLNVGGITPGAGTETAISIAAGWDKSINIVNGAAGQGIVIDSATTDTTNTSGIIQVTADTLTNNAILGYSLTGNVRDAASGLTVYGNKTLLTVDTDAGSSHTAYGNHITIDNDDATSTAYGQYIDGGSSVGISTALGLTNNISTYGATAVAGVLGAYTLTNTTTDTQFQFGNRYINTISSASGIDSTYVGDFIRMIDNDCSATDCINTVRGLEVQAWSGTNNAGTNTGIAAFGKTFGIQGTTSAQASTVSQAAAVFADLDNGSNTDLGNAIRAYTNNATTADLVSIYQESSTYTGTGLVMNFANNSGTFASGKFIDLQKASTTYFKVDSGGNVFATLSNANTFAICHANNGAGTAEQLTDCSGSVSADFAEMYPVESDVEVGDVVSLGTELINTYEAVNGAVDWNVVKGQITKLVKTESGYQSNIVGIASDNYGDFISTGYNIKEEDNPKSIALSGRVLVKITTENGNILPGDYLTSSETEPGFAMKATKPGMVIGQALAPFNGQSETNTVMVFVNTHYWVPSVAALLQDTNQTILNAQVMQDLVMTNASAFDKLVVTDTLYVAKKLVVGERIETIDLVANTVTAKEKLCIGTTCVTENQLQAVLQLLEQGSIPQNDTPPPPAEDPPATEE